MSVPFQEVGGGLPRLGVPQRITDFPVYLFVPQINAFTFSVHPDGRPCQCGREGGKAGDQCDHELGKADPFRQQVEATSGTCNSPRRAVQLSLLRPIRGSCARPPPGNLPRREISYWLTFAALPLRERDRIDGSHSRETRFSTRWLWSKTERRSHTVESRPRLGGLLKFCARAS
jgi:hypothetical protein